MLRVAVIGSGPSGVYTAQSLVAQDAVPDVEVYVLDRLPCPYGLVRYGVAPDHEKIKSLQNNLRTVLEHPRVHFLGNVDVGAPGLGPAELREIFHAVVYCVGAATDRRLGIPGEELPGSRSATDFVSWYSAHPDAAADRFPLTARSAVVVGVGNVAVDVARVLARGAAELAATDVPQAALGAFGSSRVRDVWMVGRRGPSQAKFTTKELRELGALPGAEVVVRPEELTLDPAYADPAALPATNRRNVEVLRTWAERARAGSGGGPNDGRGPAPGADGGRGAAAGSGNGHGPSGSGGVPPRRIHLRFFLRPVEVLGDAASGVRGVRFERTVPDGRGGVTGTGRYEDIPAQLVLRSVGYRGTPQAGLPFDAASGTVPHEEGRVLRDGTPSPGEYVAGWIKRGPTGVIGTNRPCAKQTAASLLADAEALVRRTLPDDPVAALRRAGRRPVRWPGWLGIEAAEAALGRELGRTTVKIPDWEGLLAAARTAG
ncbi:FAD-dependent oxidoreductase [Streptomyces sp. NPDC003077]|uniref:FAD-dependent oxidoreductase n=1 Tax=Streptomyces sp. NPDC003077 TaxID=3154443 RepID=UPI0033AC8FE9